MKATVNEARTQTPEKLGPDALLLLLRLILNKVRQFWSTSRRPVNSQLGLLALVCLATLGCPSSPPPGPTPELHFEDTEAWFEGRLARLTSPDSWLTLVGLAWIPEGISTFGSADSNDIVIPLLSSPPTAGHFRRSGAEVVLVPEDGANLEIDGQIVTTPTLLSSDADGDATLVRESTVSFHLIARGDRIGLRQRDSQSRTRIEFAGIQRYPVSPNWRMEGRLEPAAPGSTHPVPNITGDVYDEITPGWVAFSHAGAKHRLLALDGGDSGRLFLVFGDETNGAETYGSGRFLYSEPPDEQGRVVVDFNRSYNPPCVFTPWATCPLPPRGNRLPFAVKAGELAYAAAVPH